MSYTKGPWYKNAPLVIIDGAERTFGVDGPPSDFFFLKNESDADLIAAAPEMYESLVEMELFVRWLGLDSEPARRASEYARAVIAKAKGGVL